MRGRTLWRSSGNCRGLIVDDSRVPKDGLDYQLATMALESGRNIKWVAVILGHSDPTITLRTYAYAMHKDNDDLGFLANNRGESVHRLKPPQEFERST